MSDPCPPSSSSEARPRRPARADAPAAHEASGARTGVRPWMRASLRLAGAYNIAFGALAVAAPAWMLSGLLGVPAPAPTALVFWQCIGMIVGVYGLAYLIAAADPVRHWPIILVGLLGKVLGPIGFVDAVFVRGALDAAFAPVIILNDLVWWVPFTLVLAAAYRENETRRSARLLNRADDGADISDALRQADAGGADLLAMSRDAPLLVVFLRHMGCTFCRETLHDLAAQRAAVDRARLRIVLVHMSGHDEARPHFERLGLGDAVSVSDPTRRLYSAFELRRGRFTQLFGPRVWIRGVAAGLIRRHGVGRLQGDGFQMPGAFVVRDGRIVVAYRHDDAADRPDYGEMAQVCDPRARVP